MSFIFIGLDNKKFRITVDQGKPKFFEPDDHVGIGKLLARYPSARVSGSSSIDWPEDGGFPKGFNAGAIIDKAHMYAFEKLAVKVPLPTTLKKAEAAIKRAAKSYKYGFPLPLKLLRMAKDGGDALAVFFQETELDHFIAGIRFCARLPTRPPKTKTRRSSR